MIQSQCLKCGNNSFEAQKKRITGLNYEITFVQCSKCGCVIGVLDTEIIGGQIVLAVDTLGKLK